MSTLWHGGEIIGETTSGGWGYRVNASIALGMVRADLAEPGTELEVEIYGVRCPAVVQEDQPLWDPENKRTKGMSTIPETARVVIIGGGVIGCSVAYHLAKLGWKDVVLLERKQLTSGTTWHAAGLIGQLRATATMTKLAKYSADLYGALEAETGVATGMRACGSITVALSQHRREEILRQASMARAFGVDVEEINPNEVKKRYPHLNTSDVLAGVHIPGDGQADPANIALALAKGARQNGAQVLERVCVSGIRREGRQVTGVDWQQG